MTSADPASSGRWLLAVLLAGAAGCAHGLKTLPRTEGVQGYVYARSADETLGGATALLEKQGFTVTRQGTSLGTNFIADRQGRTVGVRVDALEVDSGHWRIQAERFVLTASTLVTPGDQKNPASFQEGERPYMILRHQGENIPITTTLTQGASAEERPSTLTGPPKGMAIGQRLRDDELEWELLSSMDRPAAAAIDAEDRRASGKAIPAPAPPADVVRSAGPCGEHVAGVEELAFSRRLVLLGDFPGTREIPDLVGRLACQAALTGVPVMVGLELIKADQPALDAFLAPGAALDEAAFLQASASFGRAWQDGRTSQAVLGLILRLRTLRDAGLAVRAFAFDDKGVAFASRNLAMARAIEDARRKAPDALMLVMVGNLRARSEMLPDAPGYQPLGWQLARWGLRPVSLRVRFEDGTAWYCTAEPIPNCGVHPVVAPRTAVSETTLMRDETRDTNLAPQDQQPLGKAYPGTVRIWGEEPQGGFHGEFVVGALTASPPAVDRD
jgi:hypothetical protein